MDLYIRAASIISAQDTFGKEDLPAEVTPCRGVRAACVEPDYGKWIDPRLMRRMSRIIKMGAAAAMECLRQANTNSPDAIITGTAYGCLEDTETFLKKMVEQQEELLTPTSFIQSTHNTVGAQIALLLKCHAYNNTHVHRGFSFENALTDAMILLQENEAKQVLVGGVDELTATSHAILSRFGLFRNPGIQDPEKPEALHAAGEGAGFFLLTTEPSPAHLARLEGISTFYRASAEDEIEKNIRSFLEAQSLSMEDIDLVLSGEFGASAATGTLGQPGQAVFAGIPVFRYKMLCGEYPTSAAFALWMATQILRRGRLPAWIPLPGRRQGIRRILIYNQYFLLHHALYLVTAC